MLQPAGAVLPCRQLCLFFCTADRVTLETPVLQFTSNPKVFYYCRAKLYATCGNAQHCALHRSYSYGYSTHVCAFRICHAF